MRHQVLCNVNCFGILTRWRMDEGFSFSVSFFSVISVPPCETPLCSLRPSSVSIDNLPAGPVDFNRFRLTDVHGKVVKGLLS